MHNKRIGRDDLLKIEVIKHNQFSLSFLTSLSGLELHHRHHGDSILDVIVLAIFVIAVTVGVNARRQDEVRDLLLRAAVTILLERMTAVIDTMIAGTGPVALTIVTETATGTVT